MNWFMGELICARIYFSVAGKVDVELIFVL